MVYDPTLPTVRSLILANLFEALEAVVTPTYGTELGGRECVRIYDGSLLGFNAYPCAAITPMQEELSDSTLPLIERTARFAVTFAVQGTDADGNAWREQIDRMHADLMVALTVDPYRGTLEVDGSPRRVARTTQIIGSMIFDTAHNDHVGMGQLELVVEFGHLYADPNTPY